MMSSGGVGKSVGWEVRGHLWKHYIINVPNILPLLKEERPRDFENKHVKGERIKMV